jgi:hypothetical protein
MDHLDSFTGDGVTVAKRGRHRLRLEVARLKAQPEIPVLWNLVIPPTKYLTGDHSNRGTEIPRLAHTGEFSRRFKNERGSSCIHGTRVAELTSRLHHATEQPTQEGLRYWSDRTIFQSHSVPNGLAITTTFGTSHGPTQPLRVNWMRLSSRRFRHSLFGTSGNPRSLFPQQQPRRSQSARPRAPRTDPSERIYAYGSYEG